MYRTSTYIKELDRVINAASLDLVQLKDKTFIIAGATGMIGSALTDILLRISERENFKVRLILLSRSIESLYRRFSYCRDDERVVFFEQDVSEEIKINEGADYIIHAASDANPIAYAMRPVEVMEANFLGMLNLLKYGKKFDSKRIMYVSSGEVYGKLDSSHDGFDESYSGYVDYSDSRSCYPSSKRAAEVLCQSYIKEYGSDVVIVRPCHIYGPTMTESDTRAATAFIRLASERKDIVLKSDGSAQRTMCYVFDATIAMLYALLKGENGNAYNISNEECSVTIKEIATVASELAETRVVFDIPSEIEAQGFNRVRNATLYSNKLCNIGWKPMTSLNEGIGITLNILSEQKES